MVAVKKFSSLSPANLRAVTSATSCAATRARVRPMPPAVTLGGGTLWMAPALDPGTVWQVSREQLRA